MPPKMPPIRNTLIQFVNELDNCKCTNKNTFKQTLSKLN